MNETRVISGHRVVQILITDVKMYDGFGSARGAVRLDNDIIFELTSPDDSELGAPLKFIRNEGERALFRDDTELTEIARGLLVKSVVVSPYWFSIGLLLEQNWLVYKSDHRIPGIVQPCLGVLGAYYESTEISPYSAE